ncbi:MAG TPA: c-type cytochrome [Usitatibacter sp.]|nr:c-type cytochrome [Usitatibacter sp.]
MPKPDLERGRQLATTICAACHGADGRATAPSNPNLAAQHGDYIAAQLAAFKAGTRPSPIMQPMAAPLTPEDMRSVGAYYESQKPVEALARDKALAQRGEKVWRGGIKGPNVPACAGCHGAAGHGIPAQYPRLAGQNAELSYAWLKAYATGARPHPVMGPLAAKLPENDMKAVAEYIAGLR